MEVSGSYTLYASRERVWAHLLDPSVLKRIIPGCEMLELEAPDHFRGRVNVNIAAVRGSYEGTLQLLERVEPEHLRIVGEGNGTRGVMRGDGVLTLEARAPATTIITYAGEVLPGGTLANVGMRVLGGVARMLINQFFARLADELDTGVQPATIARAEPHSFVHATDGIDIGSAPFLLETTLPEARALDDEGVALEARPLDEGPSHATMEGAGASSHSSSTNLEPGGDGSTIHARADSAALNSARSALRRAGLTDGSIESEQRLIGRAAILAGVLLAVVITAIGLFSRRSPPNEPQRL